MTEHEDRDPWYFQRWAFKQKTGNPARKAVLQALATMADAGTGRGEVKQKTLAEGVEVSPRSISTYLNHLERDGFIVRRPQFRVDRGRRGDEFLLLAPGVDEWPDGQKVQPANPAGGSPGSSLQGPPAARCDTPMQLGAEQEQPPLTPSSEDHAPKQEDTRDVVPPDFPLELREHGAAVFAVLQRVAEQHRAQRVWKRAVALAIVNHRGRAYVEVAHDLEAWAVDPGRQIKDVVATYRTFLKRARQIQGIERLVDGVPVQAPAARANGTTGHRMSNADHVEANLRLLRGDGPQAHHEGF